MMKWNPTLRAFLQDRLEPANQKFDILAVAVEKCDFVVGHLSKRFTKTISFFRHGSNENPCKAEVTVKKVNLGDGEGLQVLVNFILLEMQNTLTS